MVTKNHASIPDQIRALYQLAQVPTRDSLSKIYSQIGNPILDPYIINALGRLSDSRAFFPVAFTFQRTGNIDVKKRCLQYFVHSCDPRAQDILEEYMHRDDAIFTPIAQHALTACSDPDNFLYSYLGSNENLLRAKSIPGRIEVNPKNILSNWDVIQENSQSCDATKPQTYIILPDKTMYVGGLVNEHVDVAQGSDVLAAGEIIFRRDQNMCLVEYLNNRSNGYLPHAHSFKIVKEVLESTNIPFSKNKFDEVYPQGGFNNPELIYQYCP